ncbi:hypothetical protein [Flavobacterium sp. N502540]|uniref:hypothetical protein n=1 Tax=Flavobacterium sp. N502540 TaxID=2986838 RepID=UPI0022255A4E|nr:hypothetical protein [Flavobacterium sp. N502540]
MKINKPSKAVIATTIILLVILFLPVGIFMFNFWKKPISSDAHDWATFADYIGGTVNTLITLLSLVVLGYLTYYIGKNSSEENKNMGLLLKRIDAYDALAIYYPDIQNYNLKIKDELIELVHYSNSPKIPNKLFMDKCMDNMSENQIFYNGFLHFVSSYPLLYGHLFSFNFESQEFLNLCYDAYGAQENINTVKQKISNRNEINNSSDYSGEFGSLKNNLKIVLTELKKELK